MTRLQPFFSIIELSTGYLHLAEIQKIIKTELKMKTGIYGFLCKTNNKLYIGSSINLNLRFNNHINGVQSNILFQRAINKYNLQDFIFIVFKYCEPDKLVSREQYYLNFLEPEYNILMVAGSSLDYKHTEEALTKISETSKGKLHSPETKGLMSETHKGKEFFLEHRTKISTAKKDKKFSLEHRTSISAAKGIGTIFVYDLQGSLKNTFSSARNAAEFFNCFHPTITKYTISGKLFKKQWILSLYKK
jgi:group I intron endonuclease